ncbi:hypothetical protein D3C72_1382880 [compost metagenome]
MTLDFGDQFSATLFESFVPDIAKAEGFPVFQVPSSRLRGSIEHRITTFLIGFDLVPVAELVFQFHLMLFTRLTAITEA